MGMSDLGQQVNSILSAATPNGAVKVQIKTEPAGGGSEQGKSSRISSVQIDVVGTNIFVPRSAYMDLIDPRQAKVEFKGDVGAVTIEGGDGAEAYLARIFFDREKINRRTLSSAMFTGKVLEETRYLLRVIKDE